MLSTGSETVLEVFDSDTTSLTVSAESGKLSKADSISCFGAITGELAPDVRDLWDIICLGVYEGMGDGVGRERLREWLRRPLSACERECWCCSV